MPRISTLRDRLDDAGILDKAHEEQRILLTHDLDFAEIIATSRAGLPSVVIFRLRNMSPIQVNRHLQTVISRHSGNLLRGAVVSVSDSAVRVRLLPIEGDR
jgi:predicted nuclease of predicted toxin-antitoxin system